VEKVQGGTIDFDRCIATPDLMPLVGRLGKVLGPRGMMPNPKVGTVTMDVTGAVKGAKGGSVEFRSRRPASCRPESARRHSPPRSSFRTSRQFADAVQKAKPAGAKAPSLIASRCLHYGPGVKVEPASLFPQAQS
jgi:large subunit ribosomal protein L1